MLKMFNLTSYWKPQACGQTALPDKSIVIGQKLVENAKIEKLKCDDILGDFSTESRVQKLNSKGESY